MALKKHGIRVDRVEVTTIDSGVTEPNSSSYQNVNLTNEQIATVTLAGMYAEDYINPNYDVATAIRMLAEASSDRVKLYKLPGGWWFTQEDFAREIVHNRAKKFVQDNQTDIEHVAEALLTKNGLPKVLTEQEIDSALNP